MVIEIKACLIKCFTGIAQWTVHINQHLPVFAGIGPLQDDAAGKVLGHVGSEIDVMPELLKLDAERLVVAAQAHDQFIGAVVPAQLLGPQQFGNEPSAQRTLRR